MMNPAKESSSLGISKSQHQEYSEGRGKRFPSAHGMEVSGWPKSDRCTLPAEQPQIGAIITESRYVMMSLVINHFPVCLLSNCSIRAQSAGNPGALLKLHPVGKPEVH